MTVRIFSVIIPAYNAEQTIEKALASVVRQTKAELVREVIVVDDGSTDGTAACARAFRGQCSFPIQVINQKNAGPSAARNAGIRAASGDYIAFLDADDEWLSDKLENQWKVLQENPQIDLLSGGLTEGPLKILFRPHTKLYHVSIRDYCWKSFIYTSTVVVRRARAADAGYFDEALRYSEDMNYFQRFFKWGKVYYLPRKLAEYGRSKAYYGQTGLSGQLKKMHQGRKHNFDVLLREKQISMPFYLLMVFFGNVKYMRRCILVRLQKRKSMRAEARGQEQK